MKRNESMHHYDVLIDRDKTDILPTKRKQVQRKSGAPWKSMGIAGGIGFEIVVPIVGLLFLGVFLDKRWDTHPTMTMVLLVFGILLSIRVVARMIKEMSQV